ncbi:MAG: phosphoribosylanthranilate isomerase [Woronichinia naegeliana WA131]|jgi:phosphoribosylanthranilate isomerase|uniref:N-(5'-phosphoribosyl)anthranilate isomerase n=1 Tax=Woronichinia naegeliana WA131 TaxID=2824559 RepID=A0A977PXJ9_9CYAN|nr:MAG: phosphoribosylanthranilate isomerase [Woronichinia naegeliana WA131]
MDRQLERVKICGIRQPEQGKAIAALGIKTLGFICVPSSPRYVTPDQISQVLAILPPGIESIGVFANSSLAMIEQVVRDTGLIGIQLHGLEPPEFCQAVKRAMPQQEIIKALRIENAAALVQAENYFTVVDTLLLDAYHPQQLGGTGQTLPWDSLSHFRAPIPWLLAGGLTPENVLIALSYLNPDGIDLSSGVERSPADKDLEKVKLLLEKLQGIWP